MYFQSFHKMLSFWIIFTISTFAGVYSQSTAATTAPTTATAKSAVDFQSSWQKAPGQFQNFWQGFSQNAQNFGQNVAKNAVERAKQTRDNWRQFASEVKGAFTTQKPTTATG